MMATPYYPIEHLSENERIKTIGQLCNNGHIVAFITDSGPGDEDKPDRYVKLLKAKYSDIVEVGRVPNYPVENTTTIKVRRTNSSPGPG